MIAQKDLIPVDNGGDPTKETFVLNLGPQHPSTHGVLRLELELDGETVVECKPIIGYLHTGIEKTMEYRTFTQGVTLCTRMDYLTPMFQETAYCLAIESLLGITDDIPDRASVIRVLMMELTWWIEEFGEAATALWAGPAGDQG